MFILYEIFCFTTLHNHQKLKYYNSKTTDTQIQIQTKIKNKKRMLASPQKTRSNQKPSYNKSQKSEQLTDLATFLTFLQLRSTHSQTCISILLHSAPDNILTNMAVLTNDGQSSAIISTSNRNQCDNDKLIMGMQLNKKELIHCLRELRVEGDGGSSSGLNNNKLCKLTGIEPLVKYCQLNGLDFKNICKFLLISEINPIKKSIRYRHPAAIMQIIQQSRQYLEEQHKGCGEVQLVVSKSEDVPHNQMGIEEGNERIPQFLTLNKLITLINPDCKTYSLHWDYNCSTILEQPRSVGQEGQTSLQSVPAQLLPQISRFKIYKLAQTATASCKLIFTKSLRYCLTASAQLLCLHKFIRKQVITSLTSMHQATINVYMCASLSRQTHQRNKNSKTIQAYLVAQRQRNMYHQGVSTKKVQCYFHTFRMLVPNPNYNTFSMLKTNRDVSILQNSIRSFLTRTRYLHREQELYLHKHRSLREKSQKLYIEVVNEINKMLQARANGHMGYGVQCTVWVANISSWSNCEEFSPHKVLQLFKSSLNFHQSSSSKAKLTNPNATIIKISMEGSMLKVFRSDDRIFTMGVQQQLTSQCSSQRKDKMTHTTTIKSEDNRSEFKLDSQGKLYGRGANQHGQLGISSSAATVTSEEFAPEFVRQWTKIGGIKAKIKSIDCRGKRCICLTDNNSIYRWGYFQQQIHPAPVLIKTPSFLKGKNIKGVSCGFAGFFVLCQEGSIYDLDRGLLKTIINRKGQDEQVLLTTGNSLLEITYGVGVGIDCYDGVKRRGILKWFQQNYQPCMTVGAEQENEECLLLSDDRAEDKQNRSSRANGRKILNRNGSDSELLL